ncbi:MAG TPA: aldose epimerase family protein [Tepidisphaeraceae bacterium]|nr:aldose epimerase family protein [Tepidisphaeraceae bacterium]
MKIEKAPFGTTSDGTTAELYSLINDHGVVAKITTYGARLTELHVPDRTGTLANIVLGYDNLQQYLQPEPYFGTTVGRVANRIGGAKFTLDGVEYKLAANDGPNTLHGGLKGFDKRLWKASILAGDVPALRLTYASPHMEEGFPGDLSVTVVYTLNNQNELLIEYSATTDRATPINLTNHSYFNLAGAGQGDVLSHVLMLAADHYTPVDATLIPTGQIAPVKGTPMDFTTPTPIGQRIAQVPGGYDHNYCLRGPAGTLALAARVLEKTTGRVMEVSTTHPGVQFYTGNFLDGTLKGNGGVYRKHFGFCLETQHYPDAVHHPNFPSILLRPGQTYTQVAKYRFSVQ